MNGLTEEFLVTQVLSNRYEALNDFIDELIECDLCVAHNGDFNKNFLMLQQDVKESIHSSGCR